MVNRHFCKFDAYIIFIHSINIYIVPFASLNERFFFLDFQGLILHITTKFQEKRIKNTKKCEKNEHNSCTFQKKVVILYPIL